MIMPVPIRNQQSDIFLYVLKFCLMFHMLALSYIPDIRLLVPGEAGNQTHSLAWKRLHSLW